MSTRQAPEHGANRDRKLTPGRLFAASLLPVILLTGAVWFYMTHPLPRFEIVFVAAKGERNFPTITPFGNGMDQDMARRFCEHYGLTHRWLEVQTQEEAWQALREGRAQVMAATGFVPEQPDPLIVAGPAYETARPLLLSHQRRPLDLLSPRICEHEVSVAPAPEIIGSLKAYGWQQECRADYSPLPGMDLAPLMREQNEMSTRAYMAADPASYRLLAPFYTRIRPADRLPEPVARRWLWRADEHMLDERMRAFFRRMNMSGRLAELRDHYFGFFPQEGTAAKAAHFRSVLRLRLPAHADTIREAARENRLDPLLLVAVIYQESAFDTGAVSHTGVRGLMQLTRETAQRFGVADRTDPVLSIRYGARYLARIWERLEPLNLAHWDRWFMTLASYNQGIGHIFDAMLLTRRMGEDPRQWRNVARALKLLEDPRHYAGSVYGHTRGSEGVQYVNRIRFYYYILKGWALLPGLELDELSLLRLSLADLGLP